ncbi:hypothetical protein BH09SUM1_BH09SUM1_23360 [soil metagenome]
MRERVTMMRVLRYLKAVVCTAVLLTVCTVAPAATEKKTIPLTTPDASATPSPTPAAGDATTSPTLTAAVTEDTPIDFNLRGANIDAVVTFITQHTGKPVVKDKTVSPQLTITTPKKVTSYQALDLIYDALRIEGFAVIETEDLIQIVPAADTAKYDIMTFSGPLPPDVVRQRGRLIRRIIPLTNVRAGVMKAYLDPIIGKSAAVAADERTNKLLITDSVRNIERYEAILKELDVVGFDNMEVKVVPLEHADATVLTNIVTETIVKAAPSPTGGPDKAAGTVVVMADVRTNSIIVAAPMERMNSVVDFISKLDNPKPKDVSVHVVQIEFADAGELANAVSDLFRKRSGKSMKDEIDVRATGQDNALLILASDENYRLIMDVVKTLDTEEAQKRETRKFELKHLDAEDTAKELGKLYGDMQSNNRGYNFFGGSSRSEKEVTFVPITRSNSVMVIAPPSEFKLIESLVEEIDKPVNAEDILPKIYRIRNAKASEVEKVLNSVFGEEKSSNNNYYDFWYGGNNKDDKSGVGRLTGKVKFSSDENTNSIIAITNNRMNYEVVDKMIEKLDTSIPELANTIIVPLQYADAVRLADTLNSLFGKPVAKPPAEKKEGDETTEVSSFYWWGADSAKKEGDRPISNLIEQVRFVPDPRTNAILVTTSAQNFPIVRQLVQDLDKEEPQVLIKVRIIEVTRTKDKRIGLRWTPDPSIYSQEDMDQAVRVLGGLDFIDTFGGKNGGDITAGNTNLNGRNFSSTMTGERGIISSSVNLNLLFQLLMKNLDAEIVINPTLYVSNNQKGHLFVGQNVPRLKGSQFTPEGSRNDSIDNEDIGINMDITPNISRNGQVVLSVMLTTAQLTGETRFGSDILQKREYNTKIAVAGGETMVVGGIRLGNDLSVVRKVPILGDIPFLGELFKNRNTNHSVTDLYAFITPEIVSTREHADTVTTEIKNTIGSPPDPSVLKATEKLPKK